MVVKIIILLNSVFNMKVQIHEQKHQRPEELERTAKIILTREEYDALKTVFCKGKGWKLDYPHTVNVSAITLSGNYKWMPASSVEFQIKIEGQDKDQRIGTRNNDTRADIEKGKN